MEICDPSPHNKRDVIVYFYDKDAFCNALRKNGSQMLSYTFDALYNPYSSPSSLFPLEIFTDLPIGAVIPITWSQKATGKSKVQAAAIELAIEAVVITVTDRV